MELTVHCKRAVNFEENFLTDLKDHILVCVVNNIKYAHVVSQKILDFKYNLFHCTHF